MSKLTRVTQMPFGTSGPTGDFGAFGSKAANPSSPIFTQNPVTIQSLSEFAYGWGQAIIGNYEPPLEDFNGLFLLIFYQLGYLLQMGLAEYDSGTTYYVFSRCQFNGVSYVSLQNNNIGNEPDTNPSYWQCISSNAFGGNVASTSSMTLPNIGSSFKITGTTTINNISIQPAGVVIELIFTGVLTVNTGGNILLTNGAFSTAANSTLMLISDGTSWYELSRSPSIVPGFGSPIGQSANTPYQATTAGFVYGACYCQAGDGGNQQSGGTFYSSLTTPPSSNPNATITIFSYISGGSTSRNEFPFCFPVAAGEYYEISLFGPDASSATVYFRSQN